MSRTLSDVKWKMAERALCERAHNNETGSLGQGIAIWPGSNNVRVPGHEADEVD